MEVEGIEGDEFLSQELLRAEVNLLVYPFFTLSHYDLRTQGKDRVQDNREEREESG